MIEWSTTLEIAQEPPIGGLIRDDYERWLICLPLGVQVGDVEGQGAITKSYDSYLAGGTALFSFPDGSCCNARYLADAVFGVENVIQETGE